ncbi:MAG TPA: ABC transporter permease [Gemmatimonadaceae bacterium]
MLTKLKPLGEGVVIAIDALRANKVRAALTILGIAIGVFVVVIISAAIHGINAGVTAEFERAGPTTFFVNRFPITFEACDDSEDTCKWRNNPPFTIPESEAIQELPSVRSVTIRTGIGASVKYKDRQLSSTGVSAYTSGWLEVDGGDITQGRDFTQAEDVAGSRVVIINDKMAERLFGESEPLGKVIMIRDVPFEVIGIYAPGGSFMGEGERPRAIVSLTAGRRSLNANIDWADLTVKPRGDDRDGAIDDVTAVLRSLRGLRPGQPNDFAIITQDKLFETWGRMTGVFFLVMFVLSGVGLIVGGVGVVAIMMISVTERTREIGVRKALGATGRVILWQFLVEAVTLTAIGAIAGLVFGWLIAMLIRSATPIDASVPAGAIVAALLASCLTGILFGMLPATKAARLDPVEALRYE